MCKPNTRDLNRDWEIIWATSIQFFKHIKHIINTEKEKDVFKTLLNM